MMTAVELGARQPRSTPGHHSSTRHLGRCRRRAAQVGSDRASAGLIVALERGPLVYCVEGADNSGRVLTLTLPDDAQLETTTASDLRGGVTLIRGEGIWAANDGSPAAGNTTEDGSSGAASRPAADGAQRAQFTALPYCAWSNLGVGKMAVWVRRTEKN